MDNFYEPKQDIYDILSDISGIDVYYDRPEVIENLETRPAVTYLVLSNAVDYTLGKDIARQNIRVQIHVWGINNDATRPIAVLVEGAMRENNYLLSEGFLDIPEPSPDGYSHLVGTFVY